MKKRFASLDALFKQAVSTVDPVKKQELTYHCRIEQEQLENAFTNISNVSKKLDMVFNFVRCNCYPDFEDVSIGMIFVVHSNKNDIQATVDINNLKQLIFEP